MFMILFKKKIKAKEEIMIFGQCCIRKYTSDKYKYFTKDIIELFISYMEEFEIDDDISKDEIYELTHSYLADAIYDTLSNKEYVSHGILATKVEAMYTVWYESIKWIYKKGLISKDSFNKSILSLKESIDFSF